MSLAVSITKCMFCDGYIPASYDDVFIKHMNDHHLAFVNIKFLFQISLLSGDELDHLMSASTKKLCQDKTKTKIACLPSRPKKTQPTKLWLDD